LHRHADPQAGDRAAKRIAVALVRAAVAAASRCVGDEHVDEPGDRLVLDVLHERERDDVADKRDHARDVFQAVSRGVGGVFAVLLIVVAAWTGPWSPLPKISWFKAQAVGCSALAGTCTAAKPSVAVAFNFAPYIGGTAILASWLLVAVLLLSVGRLKAAQIGEVFRRVGQDLGERRVQMRDAHVIEHRRAE